MIGYSDIMIAYSNLPKSINYKGMLAKLYWSEGEEKYILAYKLENGIEIYRQEWNKDLDLDVFNRDIQSLERVVK